MDLLQVETLEPDQKLWQFEKGKTAGTGARASLENRRNCRRRPMIRERSSQMDGAELGRRVLVGP